MPVGIRSSYKENVTLGLLRAETVRNIYFNIEYSLSGDLSAMAHGNAFSYSSDFKFHPDTTLQSYW